MGQLSKTVAENYRNGVSFVLKNPRISLRKGRKERDFLERGPSKKKPGTGTGIGICAA